jgi:hypothetical protein
VADWCRFGKALTICGQMSGLRGILRAFPMLPLQPAAALRM